jgi:hypothetical protein
MPYSVTNRQSELNVKQDDLLASKKFVIERKPETVLFYELEAAIVLDVILDENHPEAKTRKLNPIDWPVDANGSPAVDGQPDFGCIGMIKFRFLNSQRGDQKEVLLWAYPMENTGITEWPLMNELVVVGKYINDYYYTRKVNLKRNINTNASMELEQVYGNGKNTNEYKDGADYTGPISKLNGGPSNDSENPDYVGVLGEYFKFNPNIRTLKRYEGDTIIESRFGQSIRFGSYDDVRARDSGVGDYADNGGNPMILIRNKQASISGAPELTKLVSKGFVTESINNDGSSIHMTSGKTVSRFVATTELPFINILKPLRVPALSGDQIVMNSDRLVFSSKKNETLMYSKKYFGIATDNVFSLTAKSNVTLSSTEGVIVFNAKKVYLGFDKDGPNDEPVLLGGQTTLWLQSMCNALATMLNAQIETLVTLKTHFHIATGPKAPTTPPAPPFIALHVQQAQSIAATQAQLMILRSQISSLQSSRAFVGK